MIYLDYQATTPVAPEVAEAMRPWIADKFANPHSPSRWGREAAAAIEVARDQVERRSGCRAAASPSPAARPRRSTGRSRARSRTRRQAPQPDHHHRDRACRGARHLRMAGRAGHRLSVLPVGRGGLARPRLLERALDDRVGSSRRCWSTMRSASSSRSPRSRDWPTTRRADAVRCGPGAWAGWQFRRGPDLVAVSAHKIHGPKGIGALWMREGRGAGAADPRRRAGAGLRSGTLSPALCVGFGAAAKLAARARRRRR